MKESAGRNLPLTEALKKNEVKSRRRFLNEYATRRFFPLYRFEKSRMDARQARLGITGLGYVGLPLALSDKIVHC
ncbi:MAG: hypothetical protein WBP52_03920 [Terriglobales bacterium]|jgi:hypothetical protein